MSPQSTCTLPFKAPGSRALLSSRFGSMSMRPHQESEALDRLEHDQTPFNLAFMDQTHTITYVGGCRQRCDVSMSAWLDRKLSSARPAQGLGPVCPVNLEQLREERLLRWKVVKNGGDDRAQSLGSGVQAEHLGREGTSATINGCSSTTATNQGWLRRVRPIV